MTVREIAGRLVVPILASLVVLAIAGTMWVLDRGNAASAAGAWTIDHVEPAKAKMDPSTKAGSSMVIRPDGYVQADLWTGIMGRDICGWNCFTLHDFAHNFTAPQAFRGVLAPDGESITFSNASGIVATAVRAAPR